MKNMKTKTKIATKAAEQKSSHLHLFGKVACSTINGLCTVASLWRTKLEKKIFF
jgi:hypothetical protein